MNQVDPSWGEPTNSGGSAPDRPVPGNSRRTATDVTLERLRGFVASHDWFLDHHAELVGRFDSKFVAVVGQEVVDSDADLEALSARLAAQGSETRTAYVGWVTSDPCEEALCDFSTAGSIR